MEFIFLLAKLTLFTVFSLAGIGKLMDPAGSAKAARDFGVPDALALPVAYILPVAEIAVALMLLFASTSWLGAIAALAVLGVFTGGMLYQYARGNAPDCHCFGQMHSAPVGRSSIIRNALLLVLAAVLAVQGPDGLGRAVIADGPSAGAALMLTTGVLGIFVVLHFVIRLSEQQNQILRRIEVVELLDGDASSAERDNAGNPSDSLPIGAHFPDFALPDASGRVVTFEHILAEAMPTLFFFIGPNCNPCRTLAPEVEEWREELKEKLRIVLVSSGTADDNIDKFGPEIGPGMLLQKEKELAELVYARWTPTAIYVNAEGLVASHPAVGDKAIRELIDKLRTAALDREFLSFPTGNSRPLKIGKEIPDVALTDLDGNEILRSFFSERQTLVVFWSLTCPHCRRLMDEIKEWEQTRSDHDPNLIIISDGDPDAHREFKPSSPIVIDPKYKKAIEFGMYGTPSAVLVDEKGIIRTEVAIGSPNIWALIGRTPRT
jgi:peroxiredoxin